MNRTGLHRLIVLTLALALFSQLVQPRPAQAQFGGAVAVISDIPAQIWRAVDKVATAISSKLKFVNDVAFKNSLRVLANTYLQKTFTSLSSGGAGQKGLFVQNAGTFLRDAASAAAGQYIDDYSQARFGKKGPGAAVSDARLRFVISRYLREQAFSEGTPVEQCQTACQENYGIRAVQGPLPATYDQTVAQFNRYTADVEFISSELKKAGGSEEAAQLRPTDPYYCRGVRFNTPATDPAWIVDPQACIVTNPPSCNTTGAECKRRHQEALNVVRQESNNEVKRCVKECRNGIAGAATNAILAFTSKDLAGAIESSDPSRIGKAVANALSGSESDVAQLLGATAALEVAIQDRVTGEQTKLSPGVLPRTTKVSGKTLAPTETIKAFFGVPAQSNSSGESTYTGSGVADILKGIASFINSPAGKALFAALNSNCGFNPDACKGPSNPSTPLAQLLFGTAPSGLAGAQAQFAGLGQAEFITGDPGRGEVSVTEQLASAGLIDAQFRSAIEERVTVQEALSKKLLDAQKTFGFDVNGNQPAAGYPFQSLQYLRKFRIIPVGWELAATYSQRFDPRDLSLGFLTKQYNMCGQDDQHRVCAGGSKRGEPCGQNADCGVDGNNQVIRCSASPYCGLVDPNWVLKAPRTFCRRQGAGEEIISKEFVCDQDNVKGTGDALAEGQNPPNCNNQIAGHDIGRWVVTRNTDTCADTQSCIAENDDGTCRAYGYCVQERQTFRFDGTQCSPENASCTTYIDQSGDAHSFLASTLDFRTCSADVAGCQWYCRDRATDGTWSCTETTGSKQNFTSNVQTCRQAEAGCREYIRTVNGTNLVPNSGFEVFTGAGASVDGGIPATFQPWLKVGGIVTLPVTPTDQVVTGGNGVAVRMQGGANEGLTQDIDTGYPLYERTFTASFRGQAAGACTMTLELDTDAGRSIETVNLTSDWATYVTGVSIPSQGVVTSSSNQLTVRLMMQNCGGGADIDSVQVEENGGATAYKDYGLVNNLFLNGTRQQCQQADVGCELYRPVAGGADVTAVAKNGDRCSADKVGCATYHLEPISRLPYRLGSDVNIVAPQGKQCSAADVGCEEYTNLDELARGGEAKTYFKSIKQCVKPTNANVTVKTYYTWVGSADRGFVLRSYDLVQSNQDAGPCTNLTRGTAANDPNCNDGGTNPDGSPANQAICQPGDMTTNADCAEYYDQNLQVFYRLRSQTITQTAECRPYRNTVDTAAGNNWIYYLAPRENISCSAAAAGCRAYTGNTGRATRNVMTDNFEQGSANWVGGAVSNESVTLNGHSLKISLPPLPATRASAYSKPGVLTNQLTVGKSYLVSFIAAAAADPGSNPAPQLGACFGRPGAGNLTCELAFPTGGSAQARWNPNITPPGPEWQQYTFGPVVLDNAYPNFGITVDDGDVYVDNVTLTEITDSVYLISTSVPSCEARDIGCAAYRDRAGQSQYLKSFSHICSETVVGCEALIDTQNSATPLSQTVKNVTTPADTVVTMVNNRSAYCPASAKGCEAFGQPVFGTEQKISKFTSVYLKNDPDRHSTDLCLNEEISCQAYTLENGTAAFFKDPGNRTCSYNSDAGRWIISGTNYLCPTVIPPAAGRPIGASCSPVCRGGTREGRACATAADCPQAEGSILVPACVGNISSAGYVQNNGSPVIGQCTDDNDCLDNNSCIYLAGTCPDGEDGCNEYRDPTDPKDCRSECPLIQDGGSPVYVDGACTRTKCAEDGGQRAGQNCQNSDQCADANGPHLCVGASGAETNGLPGCRAYFYLRQSVEDQAGECNGQVDPELGCRPFNDTSKSDLNFRGQ